MAVVFCGYGVVLCVFNVMYFYVYVFSIYIYSYIFGFKYLFQFVSNLYGELFLYLWVVCEVFYDLVEFRQFNYFVIGDVVDVVFVVNGQEVVFIEGLYLNVFFYQYLLVFKFVFE